MSDARAVAISENAPLAMLTLRGDLAASKLVEAVEAASGCAMPATRRIVTNGDNAVAWMASDEVMLFLPRERGNAALQTIGSALAGSHHLIADVSDARTLFRIEGPGARDVLAKGAPVDLHADAFGPGDFRRTRLGQVAVAFWMRDDDVFELMCFRSVAGFVRAWLDIAATPGSLPDYL